MFTLGNFITLGIVVLLLIFYRQLDKRNRTLDKVRKYADHLKSELTAFVTEKENAVKDYSVSLDVEQKSAKELMKRVQITDAELAEKAKAIAKIDERITAYDSSLEELVHMTARVQENMNRLREESTFIESVNKKITDAQSKLHAVEQQTADIKMDFTKENSAYLEKLAGDILANVKSSVTELKIQSQAVERHVGEQCVAMEKAEHIRAANLQRDMDILNRTLKTVMERAANKADSLEVETLENLKAESEKRIQDLKSSIEETFRDSHVKAQEQLNKVRSIAEENQSMWEADRIEFEAKEQSRREKLNSDANALLSTLAEKSEEMKKASSEDDAKFKKFLADMEAASANVRSYIVSQNDALEQKFKETKQRIDETVNLLEIRVKNVSNEAEQRALEKADERLGNWQQLIHESDANLQKTLSSLESSSIDIQDHFAKKTAVLKQRLDEVERQIETEATDLRDRIDKISEESQAHVADEAQTNLEQILRTYEEQNGRLVRNVQELETKAESIKNYFDSESTAMSRKILDAELHTEEAAAGLDNRLQRTAMEVERKVVESTDVRLEDWKKAAADAEANLKNLLVNLETSAVAIRTDFDTEKALIAQKLMDVSLQTEKTIDGLKENIARASESVEAKIADEADAKLQQWLAASQDRNDKAKLILEGLERTTAQAKSAFDAEVASMDKRLDEAKTRSDQMIDSWSASMELRLGEADKKLADTETYVEHAILDSEKRIATAIANAELSALEKADAELVEWRKRFEEQMMNRDKVSEEESMQNRRRFEDLARSFDETKERLAREIEETKDRLTGVQGEMDAAIEKIEDAIGQAVEATDEKAESAAKNRLLQWREASKQAEAEAESRNSAFLALFNQNYEQASAEIEKLRFDLIDKFNQSYEKASAEALERMENFAEQFKKAAAEHEKQSEDLVAQWERVFADTSTQNTEELSNIEANFSKTKQCIADEITGAELRLHSIQEKMDETVHRIEYVIKDTIANTDAKAAQVADDRLAQWKQASEQAAASSEERTQALIAQWERIFADTSGKNAAELSGIEANFTESKQRISDEIAGIESRLREVKESVDNTVEGIDVDVKGVVDGAEKRLQAIQAEMDETASRIESAIKDAIVDVDVKAAQVADDRLAQWEQASGQAIASAEERTQALIAQWERIFADTSAKNAAELSVIEANFTESKQRISDEIAGIESRLREVKESVDNAVEGIDVDVKGVVDGAEKRLQAIQAEMDETASRIESAIKDAIVDVDAKAAQVADDRLAQWKQTSEQTIASAEEQANTFIAQWEQASGQAAASSEERTQALIAQWERIFADTSAKNAAELSVIEANFTESKQRISDEIADIASRLREVKESVDNAVEGIDVDVKGVVDGAERRLQAIQAEMDETASRIESAIKDAIVDVDVKAAQVADDRLVQWKQTSEQTIASAEEQANTFIAQWEQASGQAAASSEERTQALIAQWERIFADTSVKNAAELSVIEANFTESKQRISDEIAGIASRLREVKESVDNAVEGIDVDVKGVVDGAEKRLQTVQAEMDETASRIESAIKDAIVDVDAKAAQVADDRLVQWKQTSEQTIASAEEQANTFIAQWKQMYEQSITVAEERASNSIERFKKDAGENMEMNKTLLDQWKTAVETLTVQDRAQLGALRDSWNQTKNQWSGEIIDAENRLKFLESQIKESAAHIGTVMKEAVEKAESTAHNQADKRIEEWRNTVQQTDEQARRILADFETSLSSAKQSLVSEEEAMGERFKSMRMEAREAVDKLERQLQLSVEDMEQQILNSTDAKFEEYQKVQSEQFQRFEALSDDAAMLDEELRRYLSDVQERIKRDFSAFEQASGKEQAMALADFTETSNSLKVEMGNIEKEIATLKETAYNNVSEKLDIFENDFSSNLAKRSDEIDKRLNEWRRYLDNQLNALTEEGESKWKIIEASYAEQFSEKLTESYDNWLAELEKLKTEAEDFEENIRVQMKIADDSFISLKEQFTQDMENARGSAEASLKAEIGRHNLALSDTLKQSQRDIGAKLKHLQEEVETRNSELISLYETSRHSIDEWKAGFNNQLRDMETALEETRKRSKDLVAESNERLSGVRTSLEDVRTEADAHRAELFSRIDEQARSMDAAIKEAERHIKDFVHQTSLFERADTLKVELEHYIEDLHGDLDKIDQHKTESANLENQFIRIKRLEDEVNAKMTRFLSEKHRIEQMETEFNRLLQTSKAVDEKLSQLSESDDTLQAMQIQIRKFNDALDASEEKFKRIERKNQTLDATNEGIDRNFKALQESEQTVQRIGGELTYLSNEMGVLRTNIGYMAKESEKAKSVADKVASLDTTLFEIDQRISTAQASREWLARLETRLEELNKQAQDQVKLIGTLMKDNGAPLKSAKGAPPIGTRENVIKLSQQGWTVDEIARAQKLGRGEVELILELAHNG